MRPAIAIYEAHRQFSLPPQQRRWELRAACGVARRRVARVDVPIAGQPARSYAIEPPRPRGRIELDIDTRSLAAGQHSLWLEAWQAEGSGGPSRTRPQGETEFELVDAPLPPRP